MTVLVTYHTQWEICVDIEESDAIEEQIQAMRLGLSESWPQEDQVRGEVS